MKERKKGKKNKEENKKMNNGQENNVTRQSGKAMNSLQNILYLLIGFWIDFQKHI